MIGRYFRVTKKCASPAILIPTPSTIVQNFTFMPQVKTYYISKKIIYTSHPQRPTLVISILSADLIITDHQMPGMDGITLDKACSSRTPDGPVSTSFYPNRS